MHSVRRLSAAAGLALATATLTPVAAPAPVAVAAGTCIDESRPMLPPLPGLPPIPTGDGCDDANPPDTTLSAAVPPSAAGMVNTTSMTFTFAAHVNDGDTGPFGFECQFTAPSGGHDWQACTSPATYPSLADAPAGTYSFAVRAVDVGDKDRNPDDFLPPYVTDTPDLDDSPATITWGQDTTAPVVFVTLDSYDEQTPTQPVMLDPTVAIRLNSNERGVAMECKDNGKPISCTPGRWEAKYRAGAHSVAARSVDAAGNASAWSDPVHFFIPANLTRNKRSRGWKKQLHKLHFRGDVLAARKRGTRLVLKAKRVGELRLYAPTAPSYGVVRVRVGKGKWRRVSLAGPRQSLKEFTVIDRYSGMRRGRIVIEVVSTGKVVLIDAIVARPNTFPAAS